LLSFAKNFNRERFWASAANWTTDRGCENKDNRDNNAKFEGAALAPDSANENSKRLPDKKRYQH